MVRVWGYRDNESSGCLDGNLCVDNYVGVVVVLWERAGLGVRVVPSLAVLYPSPRKPQRPLRIHLKGVNGNKP